MAVTTNGSEYNTVGNIPRYTSTGTLPSSNDGRNGLFIDQNWTTQTNTTTVVFTFNPAVNSPNFIIYDINRTNACTVSLSTSSTSLSCLATAQTVTASVQAGTFSYVWSPAPSSGAGTGTVTITNPGTYSVTVTNTVNGCATDAFVTISQNTISPSVSSSSSNSISCSTTTANAVASTTTSPASYNWSGTGITSAANISTITVNQSGVFNYTVTNNNN